MAKLCRFLTSRTLPDGREVLALHENIWRARGYVAEVEAHARRYGVPCQVEVYACERVDVDAQKQLEGGHETD